MSKTHQLTIRGLDDTTRRKLAYRAARQGLSMNRMVLKTLQDSVGANSKQNDLDKYIGKIQIDSNFEEAVAELRRVDPKAWQ